MADTEQDPGNGPIEHTVTFDVFDSLQVAQNTPFKVRLLLERRGEAVSLTFRSGVSFVLPNAHDDPIPAQVPDVLPPISPVVSAAQGGILALVRGFLPPPFRPNTAIGVTATLDAEQTAAAYLLIITREGNLLVTTSGNGNIPFSGIAVFHPKTISYRVGEALALPPPKNFALSDGESQASKLTGFALAKQWYDLYWGDIYGGRFASRWADNSTTHKAPYNFNVYTRTGEVCGRGRDGAVEVRLQRKPVVAYHAPPEWFFNAGTMAINPTNPKNLVWTAQLIRNDLITSYTSTSPDQLQLWRGVSLDGGESWELVGRIDGQNGIPPAYADTNALFDRFGNHWITSTYYDPAQGLFPPTHGLMILVSSDGGRNYTIAYNPTTAGLGLFDFNQLAFGGDGNGGWALWFVNDFFPQNPQLLSYPTINYIPVTGLGQYGAGVTVTLTSLSSVNSVAAILSTITVSDEGTVFLYYDYAASSATSALSTAFGLAYKIGGVNGLVDGSFTDLGTFAINSIGTATSEAAPGLGTAFLANSVQYRGENQNVSRGLAYDEKRRVLFALVLDFAPVFSQCMTLYLVATRDGQTWSQPFVVRDTLDGNVTRPSMKRDPVTGVLYVTWYDGRNTACSYEVGFTGTIVDNSILDAIAASLPKGRFRALLGPPAVFSAAKPDDDGPVIRSRHRRYTAPSVQPHA